MGKARQQLRTYNCSSGVDDPEDIVIYTYDNDSNEMIRLFMLPDDSMKEAIDETARRRKIQEEYNKEHNIIPTTIKKEIGEVVGNDKLESLENVNAAITLDNYQKLSKIEQKNIMEKLEKQMREAAKALQFEEAMTLRDIIFELKSGGK